MKGLDLDHLTLGDAADVTLANTTPVDTMPADATPARSRCLHELAGCACAPHALWGVRAARSGRDASVRRRRAPRRGAAARACMRDLVAICALNDSTANSNSEFQIVFPNWSEYSTEY